MHQQKRNRRLAPLVHTVRVAMVTTLLLLIPSPASTTVHDDSVAPPIDRLIGKDGQLASATIGRDPNPNGLWPLTGPNSEPLGWIARTLPAATDAIGYRGPTEASILLTPELRIASVAILSSADTEEHVQAVAQDKAFFEQFEGWSWGDPPRQAKIDAVSGATLTSLALAQGVLARIGEARPSLVFADPLNVAEITPWFPKAASVDAKTGTVRDQDKKILGQVIRTGPLCDGVIGYQGPTELLLKLNPDQQIESLKIRSSFDNEPYVGYVRQERGFWSIFRNKTTQQLAEFSPQEAGVEGVSGATMTSQAIADTLVAAAARQQEQQSIAETESTGFLSSIRFTPADYATITLLLLLTTLSRFKRFHHGKLRRCWLLTVVLVIGLWSGNLISLALVAGWSAEGIAWRLAPALATLAAVSLFTPPITKLNPYCNHLCPHGAIQQLLRPTPKSKRRIEIPARLRRSMRYLPGITLVVAYLALVIVPSLDLSTWEPFHAYLFRLAGWGSIGLACTTLLITAFIPMAYCRFGCPTGRLLDHLRRTATSHRIQHADLVALALIAFAISWRYFN
ncbi:FMN-binding protein [Rubripirellula sp.]|nr:FMN-binding protein [Rubripirellula sp.]